MSFLFWGSPKLDYEMITVIYMVYRDIRYVKSIEIMLLVVELPYMLEVTYIERNDISYLSECVETVFNWNP